MKKRDTSRNVPTQGGWATVPSEVLSSSLPDAAKLLYAYLSGQVCCWRGRDTLRHSRGFIATALGWSVSKVTRALKALQMARWIEPLPTRTPYEIVKYRVLFGRETPAPIDFGDAGQCVTDEPLQCATDDPLQCATDDPQIQTSSKNPPNTGRKPAERRPKGAGGGFLLSQSEVEAIVRELQRKHGADLDGCDGRPTVEQTVCLASAHPKVTRLQTARAQREALGLWVSRQVAIENERGPRSARSGDDRPSRMSLTKALLDKQVEAQRNAAPPPDGWESLRSLFARNAQRAVEVHT